MIDQRRYPIVRTLSHLKHADPAAFDAIRHTSSDIRRLDVDQVQFPGFTVRAYKREEVHAVSLAKRSSVSNLSG